MVISLIGYRGTGKSTVAAPLARRLGWEWVDADDAIVFRANKSIQQIFTDDGEPAFRLIERDVLTSLLRDRDRWVIATGGGAILNKNTRADMRAAGPVVWLTASAETIVARMEDDAKTTARRPNLTAFGGRREVDELMAAREPLYRETASVIIDTEGRRVNDIVEEILTAIGPQLPEGAAG